MDLEQTARLDSGYTAHERIVDMINEGSSLSDIKYHCLLMMDVAKKQLLKNIQKECECKPEWQKWDRTNGYHYCTKCLKPI